MALVDVLVQIKDGLSLIQSAVVNGLVTLLASVGINVPPILIQIGLICLCLFFFLSWAPKLPKLILILLGLFFLALLVGILKI